MTIYYRGKVQKPFTPYPELWDALYGEPGLLKVLKAMTFDEITTIAKLQAVEGTEAAKAKLRQRSDMPEALRDTGQHDLPVLENEEREP